MNSGTATMKPVMEFLFASDSEDSIIFVSEKPSPSVQGPGIITGVSQSLTTFFQVAVTTHLHSLIGL